ncbi:GAF and ANTAR domain-containing protein [Streptomyces violascens]|uniref:GAF and ANTAR domain-containing protein n=1 Tax=Streptomyces violascens TaxID=67381 RepID=UPI0036C4FB61
MHPEYRGSDHDDRSRQDHRDRRRITDALAAAAAGLDVEQVPEALCRACVQLVPVTGASVSIAAASGVQVTWCASDPVAARLAEAQYTLGDGPCHSALDQVAPVLAADLTQGIDARRWPVFAQQAVELGARAAFSLPLGTGARAIGTLDLYRDRPGPLAQRDLALALLVRDALTFAVSNLNQHDPFGPDPDDGGVASWVEAAQADHMEVHQATGMVMIQLGTGPEQALDRMRARAFAQGRSVSEVARDVVARTLRFTHDTDDTGSDQDGGPAAEGRDGHDDPRHGGHKGDGTR